MNTKPSPIEKAFGLQPSEAYGEDEVCYTHETTNTYRGQSFEVYYDEMAHPLSQWKAFCKGIGTLSHLSRDHVVVLMRERIKRAQESEVAA